MEIKLSTGQVMVMDDADLAALGGRNPFAVTGNRGLRYAAIWLNNRPALVHRLIMGLVPGDGKCVDHVSGNTMDNRRSNLRIATHQENLRNQRKKAGTTSRFKGVSWNTERSKWAVRIRALAGKSDLFGGYFTNEEEAARAYDALAVEHFGEFARLNFPKATHVRNP